MMMEEPILPLKIARILNDFLNRVKEIYREEFISAALYGSAASGEFSATHSNVNLVIILRDTSISSLSKIAPVLNKGKFSLLNTVFFTEEYVKSSADVFPVEFLDIKENHKTLYGKDVFTDLNIDIKNLRFQCEQELKSKIINIKKVYLSNINNPGLDKLLIRFFTSSLHLLRNILRLKSGRTVYKKEDIINSIAVEFNIDISDMKKILGIKSAGKRLSKKAASELFGSFVNDLEKMSGLVDGL